MQSGTGIEHFPAWLQTDFQSAGNQGITSGDDYLLRDEPLLQ
jgi:hypothetical protein